MPAQRALKYTFIATLGVAFIELVGGRLTHSLALIADAAHLLTDAGALGLAFFASWLSGQPATRKMSYGFHRVEILAALVNGVGLVTIAIFVMLEAFRRFFSPPTIYLSGMLALGSAGLLFNLVVALSLQKYTRQNVNVRSAFYHVLADLLGSMGVVLAALVVWKTGWSYADPCVSIGIALLIIWGAWRILRDVVEVLLEATPSRMNMAQLERRLLSFSGVEEICDLHVWTISSGKEALSVHLGVRPNSDSNALLKEVNALLSKEFGIHHTTIQIEPASQKPHRPHDTHPSHQY